MTVRTFMTCASICAAAGLSNLSLAQVVHEAMPMVTEKSSKQNFASNDKTVRDIKSKFVQAHSRVGSPKLAIFWNRTLDDQLSQWYTASRKISTHDNWYKGKGFTASQTRLDVEDRFDDRAQPEELAGFEFDSGFTRTLLSTGISIVDRGAIMRLTHSSEKEAADKIIVADYQQIEIDALKGYADLVAEVLYADSRSSSDAPVFMITIKKVETGEIVTKFRSRPYQFSPRYEDKWVTSKNGYEKIRVPVIDNDAPHLKDDIDADTAEYVGWSVALQTMQALSKYWGP